MEKTKQELLIEWAELWIPKLNELSDKYSNPYYTQSPLDAIEEDIDIMFVGINPGEPESNDRQPSFYTPAQFLKGNPKWEKRFKDGKNVWKFTNGARFFMGYDAQRHSETIDNDSKVVWTNLSPFASKRGFSDLPKELKEEGINCFFSLLELLQPKKIIFLGGDAFNRIDKFAPDNIKQNFEHIKVFDNVPLEIGRIYGKQAYFVSHPSSPHWAVSNSFIPIFIYLRGLYDTYENGKPKRKLDEIRNIMRKEIKLWQERVKC